MTTSTTPKSCLICEEPALLRYVPRHVPLTLSPSHPPRFPLALTPPPPLPPFIVPHSCAACQRATYCSKTCQAAHWKLGHKQQCQVLRQAREKVKLDSFPHPLSVSHYRPPLTYDLLPSFPSLPSSMPHRLLSILPLSLFLIPPGRKHE